MSSTSAVSPVSFSIHSLDQPDTADLKNVVHALLFRRESPRYRQHEPKVCHDEFLARVLVAALRLFDKLHHFLVLELGQGGRIESAYLNACIHS